MKMLVVVDYQNDFVNGSLGFAGAEKLDSPIAAKIREYIENGYIVVQTMDTHTGLYMHTREGKHLPIPHCEYDTHGWQTYGDTARAVNEIRDSVQFYRINKETFGCHPFRMVDMLDWLALNGIDIFDIETIEFVGLVSNICVISNICVFQGTFPDAQIIVDPALIASHDPEMHEAVLRVMKGLQVEFI